MGPFDLRVAFPPPPAPAAAPFVEVVTGPPDALRWSVAPGAGGAPEAALHVTPPPGVTATYLEVVLGYRAPAASGVTTRRLHIHLRPPGRAR